MAGKRCLGISFANTELYKSTILLIFEAEFTESVLDKLSYPEYYKAHIGWT